VMAPLTAALAALMISRVPYPSFKVLHFRKRVQIELMAGVLVVVAMLLAMPQFTVFMLATAYVLSGPFLIVRGEGMSAKAPVLPPVENDAGLSQSMSDSHDTTP
jgi:CDP-diacylglycerol---serine O-phosphatidyltransferase